MPITTKFSLAFWLCLSNLFLFVTGGAAAAPPTPASPPKPAKPFPSSQGWIKKVLAPQATPAPKGLSLQRLSKMFGPWRKKSAPPPLGTGPISIGKRAHKIEMVWVAPDPTGFNPNAVTEGFYLGKYEVTQGQFEAMNLENPKNKLGGQSRPAVAVSRDQAFQFASELNTIFTSTQIPPRWGFRLLSETEWDFAARGAKLKDEETPPEDVDTYAVSIQGSIAKPGVNGFPCKSFDETMPKDKPCGPQNVGSLKPNTLGLYDMYGNAAEWVLDDWFPTRPQPKAPQAPRYELLEKNPRGVIRGGSWAFPKAMAKNTFRNPQDPQHEVMTTGFRVALAQLAKDCVEGFTLPVDKDFPEKHGTKGRSTYGIPLVSIPGEMLFGAHEITRGQYQAVTGFDPDHRQDRCSPITEVSFTEAVRFTVRLTELERKRGTIPPNFEFRLPTSKEWEAAALAGSTMPLSTDVVDAQIGSIEWKVAKDPVAQHAPNAWGIYGMLGGPQEWVATQVEVILIPELHELIMKNPKTRKEYEEKERMKTMDQRSYLVRGGSEIAGRKSYRVDNRESYLGKSKLHQVGFRVVLAQVKS